MLPPGGDRRRWAMRKVQLLATVLVVLAALFVPVTVAGASSAVTVTHFTVAYDFGYGLIECDGQRIVRTGPDGFVKDSETCAVTGGSDVLPNGHYSLEPVGGDPQWWSDYEFFVDPGGEWCLNPAVSGTLVVTANGHTWKAEVYYDPSFVCL
jgi:hypothetical protein